jgi:hypothetical protein
MRLRKDEVFARALRAAAATTALVLAGCGGSKGPQPQPPGNGATEGSDDGSATTAGPDAAVAAERDCADDPGYSSPCCTAEREAGRSPMACTPWGPPAPPVYRGERIA